MSRKTQAHRLQILLFVQSLNAKKVVQYAKVAGKDNPSDIGTKGLCAQAVARHINFVSGQFRSGRPALYPEIARCILRTDLEGGRSEGECM